MGPYFSLAILALHGETSSTYSKKEGGQPMAIYWDF